MDRVGQGDPGRQLEREERRHQLVGEVGVQGDGLVALESLTQVAHLVTRAVFQEQHAQLALDGSWSAVLELLGAVPALEQEAASRGGLRQQAPQARDLLGHHQGRQPAPAREAAL